MSAPKSKFLLFFTICLMPVLSACPGSHGNETPQADIYHIGTWSGVMEVEAYLVNRETADYRNEAWRVEANVRLNEYSDGSLTGSANSDLFYWILNENFIGEYDNIAVGRWDEYSQFSVELEGSATDDEYLLDAVELPQSIQNPNASGAVIEFWDFLFPAVITCESENMESGLIEGQSTIPQGEDITTVTGLSTFREFGIIYSWTIRRL